MCEREACVCVPAHACILSGFGYLPPAWDELRPSSRLTQEAPVPSEVSHQVIAPSLPVY